MSAQSTLDVARAAFLMRVDGYQVDCGPLATTAPSQVLRCDEALSSGLFLGRAVCSIGVFDGVHRGHRYLFSRMVSDARARGVSSVVITFVPDPDELFRGEADQRKLLSNDDRVEFLRSFGADYVLVVPFTPSLSVMDTPSFLDQVVAPIVEPVAVHVGSDFRLGAGNRGSVESLAELGASRGFVVHGHDLRRAGDLPVSATRIRDMLQAGDLAGSNRLLCRAHFVRGTVGHGRHEGTSFGFPTANVRVPHTYALPAEGVYAGLVRVGDSAYPAAVNVGAPKTFEDAATSAGPERAAGPGKTPGPAQAAVIPGPAERLLEANLLGFSGDLYGREVSVAFTDFLRPQRAFDSLDELVSVVNGNIDWVRDNLGETGVGL